jgi:hypothetical protein
MWMCGGFLCAPAGRVGLAGLIDAARRRGWKRRADPSRRLVDDAIIVGRVAGVVIPERHEDVAGVTAHHNVLELPIERQPVQRQMDLPVIPTSLGPLPPPERDVGDGIPGVVDADE